MNTTSLLATIIILPATLLAEDDFDKDLKKQTAPPVEDAAKAIEHFSIGATKVAGEQDELSADVQDLIQEQTNEKVIQLLEKAEELMSQATDRLDIKDTSGPTIAIETEIIERIADAAKQRKQDSQGKGQKGSKASDALMQMMEEMLGDQPGSKPGDKPGQGDTGGEGQTKESDTANSSSSGEANGDKITRRVPKNAGSTGATVPREFRKALDAYNKTNKK